MGSTWDDLFASAAAPLHEQMFAESTALLRAPLGSWDRAEEVTVYHWTEANEAGANQEDGEGEVVRNRSGERILRSASFDVLATQETDEKDKWRHNGEEWYTVRIIGRDARWKTVLVKHVDGKHTKRSRMR